MYAALLSVAAGTCGCDRTRSGVVRCDATRSADPGEMCALPNAHGAGHLLLDRGRGSDRSSITMDAQAHVHSAVLFVFNTSSVKS